MIGYRFAIVNILSVYKWASDALLSYLRSAQVLSKANIYGNIMAATGPASQAFQTDNVDKLMTGIWYGSTDEFNWVADNRDTPLDNESAANYHVTLTNSGNWTAPAGSHSLLIDVTKVDTNYTIVTKIDGTVVYSDNNFDITAPDSILMQSHWGSGVIFSSFDIDPD